MSQNPSSPISSIDRRTLIGGAGGLVLASQFSLLGGCQAVAQGDVLEAAIAALATLAPLRPEEFGATGRAGDDQTRVLAALMGEFPAGGISAIRIVDPTRALPLAARARWKLTLEGSFR